MEAHPEILYICIDFKCDQQSRMFKAKNDQHSHRAHDYQQFNEFQKLIRQQFPQQVRDQINALFVRDDLTKAVQSRSAQMHEYIRSMEENLLKAIEVYDVLGVDKTSLNQVLNQLNEASPAQINAVGLLNLLRFSKQGPPKILERWKKENDAILKELNIQVEQTLKLIGNATTASYQHIQHLQSPSILTKMHYSWSKSMHANSVTINQDAIYEKATSVGLALMEQVLEKDQIQSVTIDIKEKQGNLYLGVIDYNERKTRGKKAFSFHDWNESNHGLYLMYHGGCMKSIQLDIFSSNDSTINAKKVGFTYEQGDKLILTWNGPEWTLKITKIGSNQQYIFKVNPDGEYHFAAGLFKAEIKLLD